MGASSSFLCPVCCSAFESLSWEQVPLLPRVWLPLHWWSYIFPLCMKMPFHIFFLLTQVGSESCFFLSRAKAQLGGLTGHSRGVSTNEQQLEVGLFSAASTIVLFFFLYIKHCGALEDVDTSLFHLKPFKKCRLPCVNTQLSVLLPFWLRFGSRTFEVWWWRMWHLCVSSGWIQVGSILSKAGSDSSLSGELVSLQGRIFSLDELTWQG